MSNPDYIDVDAIQKAMDDPSAGGTRGACQKLQDEFFEAQRTLDTSSMQKHWRETIQELRDRGMLNGLTLAYTVNEFEKLSGGDRTISRSDLRQAKTSDAFAAPFADEWLETSGNKDMLERAADNNIDFRGLNRITIKDVYGELNKHEAEKIRDRRQERNREAMQPLFEDGLFTELNGGQEHGKIEVEEMKAFNKRYEDGDYPPEKAHLYTAENAKFVADLLSRASELPQGFTRTISSNDLARLGDFDKSEDIEKLQENYELRRDVDSTLSETESQSAEQKEAQSGDSTENENDSNINFNPEWATKAEIEDMFRVRKGEGYSHVAKRILEATGAPVNRGEMMALTFRLMEINGNRMLHPNDRVADLSHIICLKDTSPAFARSYDHILTQYEKQKMLDM